VAIAVLRRSNYFAPQTTRANEVLISTQAGGNAVCLVELRKNNCSQTMGLTRLAKLKQRTDQTGQTIYTLKRSLLFKYPIQQLKNPAIPISLA
jgi:hypothetical protein